MPSRKEYLEFLLEQMPEGVTYRPMMGEYILYYRGKVFGGVYDDRLLIKPTGAVCRLMPDAPMETPYEGAKEMALVETPEDRTFLESLLREMEPELPAPKKRK